MRAGLRVLFVTGLCLTGCYGGPVVNGPKPPTVDGTIAGLVRTSDPQIPIEGRRITIIEVNSGTTYTVVTAVNGGYTVKVPKGTYHIDILLRTGEVLVERPEDTHVGTSDLDPHRTFILAAAH